MINLPANAIRNVIFRPANISDANLQVLKLKINALYIDRRQTLLYKL